MSLIHCETNLILTWSTSCIIYEVDRATTFEIPDTIPFVPLAILSTQDNTKLLQQLKSGFKRIINWKNID